MTVALDLRHRADNNLYPHNKVISTGITKKQAAVVHVPHAVAANSDTAFTTGDYIKLLNIPAQSLIIGIKIEVTTAEGAACTIDVGDSGSASRYANDLDANALGATVYSTAYYVGESDIDLRITFNTAATNLFIAEIVVAYIDMTCQAT